MSVLEDEVSGLRKIIERSTGAPISVSTLRKCIPLLRDYEKDLIKSELETADPLSLIFDGSTNVCEMFVVIVRWFNVATKTIEQRLVACNFLLKSLTGAELYGFIIQKAIEMNINFNGIVGLCRDGSSVNTSAVDRLRNVCINSTDINCFSHAANRVGLKISCDIAREFISKWSSMMSTSNIAHALWKESIGRKAKKKSAVRWGAELDVVRDVALNFPVVLEVINSPLEFATQLRESMHTMTNDAARDANTRLTSLQRLKLELAIYCDAGRPIYELVYDYEGDGLLSPFISKKVDSVSAVLYNIVNNQTDCPILNGIINEVIRHERGNDVEQQNVFIGHLAQAAGEELRRQQLLIEYTSKAFAAMEKFNKDFLRGNGKCYSIYLIFKACSMLIPRTFSTYSVVDRMQLIDTICNIRQFSQHRNFRNLLLGEVPQYLNLARFAPNIDNSENLLSWWRNNWDKLPTWSRVLQIAVLYQPSSAGAERVFSMVRWMFHEDQHGCLEDYKETALMLRYNTKWRNKAFDLLDEDPLENEVDEENDEDTGTESDDEDEEA
jgi:hypothetical protein